MSDRLSDEQLAHELFALHRDMPHRFPQPAPVGEVLGWRCAACGEWVDDASTRTKCTVDWRGPHLEHVAAARLRELRAEVERLTRWKAEATIVLNRWEDAWDAVDQPGRLGDIKSGAMRDALLAERALADQLAEALRLMVSPESWPEDDDIRAGRRLLAAWEAARHE